MAQQSGGYGQNRQAEDGLLLLGIGLVFVGGALFAAWWVFHARIAAFAMALQHGLMAGAGLFTGRYAGLDAQVLAADPAEVRIGALWRLMQNVGAFYRVPAAALIMGLAAWCLLGNAPGRYTRRLGLPGLMRVQARVFPASATYVRRALGLVAVAEGKPRPGDPALYPDEWIDRVARDARGRYSEHAALAALTRQLGPPWRGIETAAAHVQAMLAVFALHAARRRGEAMALLGDLSRSLPADPGDTQAGPAVPLAFSADALAKAALVLSDAGLVAPCRAIAARHAFTAPAMMSVLSHARQRAGVLAPAQFAFLKLVDRPLWYALHALGFPGGQNLAEQPNPRIEAAGSRDHWAVECVLRHPVPAPSLDRALAVIRAAALKPGDASTPTPEHAP